MATSGPDVSASSAASEHPTAVGRSVRLHAYRWEHPDWWLWIASGVAWTALVVGAAWPGPAGDDHHQVSAVAGTGPVADLGWWALMVVAMMLPLSAGHVRWLANRSLVRRRTWTVVLHTVGYLGVWLVLGAVLIPAVRAVDAPVTVTVGALLAAAAWHVSPYRRRALRRCGAGRAPAVRGRPADLDCLRAGLRTGRLCTVTCGPAMVAMVATHHLAIMVAITLLLASERRRAPNPQDRAGRVAEAVGLAGVALAVALVAALGTS